MDKKRATSDFYSLDDVTMEAFMNQATEWLIDNNRIPNSEAVWGGEMYQELILATAEEMWEYNSEGVEL